MAVAVARTIDDRRLLWSWRPALVSAKPIAYLVPALLCGRKSPAVDRHQNTPGPAVRARLAATWLKPWGCPCRSALAQGACELLVFTSPRVWRVVNRRCPNAAACARWRRSNNGPRPRAAVIWPSCQAWTSDRRFIAVGDLDAGELPGFAMPPVSRLSCQPGAQGGHGGGSGGDQPPSVFSLIWRCAKVAWPSCCRPCAWSSLTRRTSSTRPECSSSASRSAPGRCSTWRATSWRLACNMPEAWSTGRNWLPNLNVAARELRLVVGPQRSWCQVALARDRRRRASSRVAWSDALDGTDTRPSTMCSRGARHGQRAVARLSFGLAERSRGLAAARQ